jgi:hypothetical protein
MGDQCQTPCPASGCPNSPFVHEAKILDGLDGKLDAPTDLEFNPRTQQLWITNAGTDDFTIVHDAGMDKQQVRKLRERGMYHYMPNVSGLAFTPEGNVATSQESLNDYVDPVSGLSKMEPNYFMGPTLFNASDAALITNDGQACMLGGERTCFLIHTDMLHEAPLATGIAHNKGYERDPQEGQNEDGISHKAGPNSFWYIDGMCDTLIMYDFATPHGPFSMDHSTARVHRYANINITRMPGVPSGADMDISGEDRTLYVADTGGGRVLKVWVDTATRSYDARENYTIFSSANAKTFDYWVYLGAKFEVFALVDQPSGIAVTDTHVFVNDYQSGDVLAFDKSGNRVADLRTGAKGLAGLTHRNGHLWMTNLLTNQVMHVAVNSAGSAPAACDQCGGESCARCPVDAACSASKDCATGLCQEGRCVQNEATMTDAKCVKRGELTPVIKPEPEPGDEDYVAPVAGYADPDQAVELKDQYADFKEDDCKTLNFDALLLSGYLCHVCLPNPCDNGAKCSNVPNLGYQCDCSKIPFSGDQCHIPDVPPTAAPVVTAAPIPDVVTPSETTDAPLRGRDDPTTPTVSACGRALSDIHMLGCALTMVAALLA